MSDTRPKRPTLIEVYQPFANAKVYIPAEVDAWNTYRDGLLRQALGELEAKHRHAFVGQKVPHRPKACYACQLIAEIRTALEEDV